MSLHNEIMNLQPRSKALAFKAGHTEAKQASAELSLKLEGKLEEAKQLLLNAVNPFTSKMTAKELYTAILNFLEENK